MGNIQIDLNLVVITIGALLGSAKANSVFDKDKTCAPRTLNLFLGIFCGISLAYHFANQQSVTLSGMLALLGGVSGAMVIEVFMNMLPSIARKHIKSWADKMK